MKAHVLETSGKRNGAATNKPISIITKTGNHGEKETTAAIAPS